MIIIENPLKIKYKFMEFRVNNETINEFQTMERSRILRNAKVQQLKSMIVNGDHFDSPIIINDISTKKRIIDGQHRINAIREIIKQNPDFVITLLLVVYQNLDKDEEKEIFTRWNSGTRQTGEDIIQIYSDEMPIYDILREKGLVSIYNEPGKIKFRNIVQPYIQAIDRVPDRQLKPREFVDKTKHLTKADADKIEKFILELSENTKKELLFKRATGQAALTYCYFTNDTKVFWEKFNKIKRYKQIEEAAEHEGRVGICKLIHLLNNKMFDIPIPESPLKLQDIFDEDKIKWLRQNYEKTTWGIEDLTQEFNEEFEIKVTAPIVGYYLKKHDIKKDQKFKNRKGKVYTKDVLDFMRECAKTMTAAEVRKACELKFEHEFSLGFNQTAKREGINFCMIKVDLTFKMNPKYSEIIKKYKDKPVDEIRDKIIEELGVNLPLKDINYELKKFKKK
jgi:hypothetical protein